jgi:hypothetical protein
MASKGITAKVFASWLIPHEALLRFCNIADGVNVPRSILDRLKGGFIVAAAQKSSTQSKYGHVTKTSLYEIPSGHWERLTSETFWNSGDAEFQLRDPHGLGIDEATVRCIGIRFKPSGLNELTNSLPKKTPVQVAAPAAAAPKPTAPAATPAPPPSAPKAAPVSAPSRAGRPAKNFWEDMVIAATRAILYDDTLKPKTQADVQRWMADWAIANGHGHPGETALKERARKVFLACRE